MAITAYVGKPRAGKSHGVVEHVILRGLRDGRRIVTNIPLHVDRIERDFPGARVRMVERAEMIGTEFWEDESLYGAVIVLDELWQVWPAGLKTNQVPHQHKEFLAMHGHKVDEEGNTTQLVIVMHDTEQIAAFVRQLIDTTYRITKLSHVGKPDTYRVDVYRGAPKGENPPVRERINSTYGRYRKEVWQYYRSASQSQAGDAGLETPIDERGNIWRSPGVKMFGAALAGLVILLVWSTGRVKDGLSEATASRERTAPVVRVREARGEAPLARRVEITESRDWRIGGFVSGHGMRGGEQWILLVDRRGRIQRRSPIGCSGLWEIDRMVCEWDGVRYTAYSGGAPAGGGGMSAFMPSTF